MLTADDTAGGYSVTASSAYGSLSFSLTNAVAKVSQSTCGATSAEPRAGMPAKITARSRRNRVDEGWSALPDSARGDGHRRREGPGRRHAGDVLRAGPRRQRTLRDPLPRTPPKHGDGATDACGIAVAPPFVANRKPGRLHRQGERRARRAGRVRAGKRRTVTVRASRREPRPAAAGSCGPGASGERRPAHAPAAGWPLGARHRDRRGSDRCGAGPLLLQPGRTAQPDRPAGHEPADGQQWSGPDGQDG